MIMKKYALLVFDYDGTLVDSEGLVIESLQKTAADFGYPMPEASAISEYFGLNLENVLLHFFPDGKQPELAARYYSYYSEENLAKNLFAGTLETLNYLKQRGFLLAIATNTARKKLDASLAIAKIKNLFLATCCPEDAAPKPAPDMLLKLLEKLNILPQEVLMIGDTIYDMQFAKNAAVDALAFCHRCRKKEQLAAFNPVGFIENIQELKYILI